MPDFTPDQKETIRHQFDCFIKKRLHWVCCDYFRHLDYLLQHEVSLSDFSEEKLEQLSALNEYPSGVSVFIVQGYPVTVHDEPLAKALAALPGEKRDIVLMSYFLSMKDREIAEQLHTPRSTVQYRRANALKKLKINREELYDDEINTDENVANTAICR